MFRLWMLFVPIPISLSYSGNVIDVKVKLPIQYLYLVVEYISGVVHSNISKFEGEITQTTTVNVNAVHTE